MSGVDDKYFDGVDLQFYQLLDPINRREGLDVEVEVDTGRYTNVRELIGEIREALEEGGVLDCVVLERRRTEFDWGASGVGEAIAVGIATTFFVDGLKAVIRKLVLERSYGSVMSEGAAESHARQRVAVRYDVDASELKLSRVVTREAAVEVELMHPNGFPMYRLEIIGSGPGARATRIERVETPVDG